MAQLEALIADDPADPELRYFLAMEYASAGDEPAAAEELLKITHSTEYVPAFLQAGQFLNRVGRMDEAVDALRRGIVVAKRVGDSHAEGEMAGLLTALE
jgi:thioredoxin-like negative regulator of GroEL